MNKLLIVGAGGFLGSVSRYLLAGAVNRIIVSAQFFPYGTLAVNVIGCLFIGFMGGLAESKQLLPEELRLLLIAGFLGGFTTFSTFGYESLSLIRSGQPAAFLSYIFLHIIFGLGAVWAGFGFSKII